MISSDDIKFYAITAWAKLRGKHPVGRASVVVEHRRLDPATGEMRLVGRHRRWNLITDAGRRAMHKQLYGTSGLLANGFNYIALSDDAVTETGSSTTLSNEIVANGLSRAQGTVTLPTGSGNVTTISHTFTCTTAPQAAQKMAVFTASSSGTMQHVLGFPETPLLVNDTLLVTLSITLG